MTLIPRSLLLNKAARSAPILSPDGRQVAWLAPHAGAKNIWLADVSKLAEARSVSNETASAVREIRRWVDRKSFVGVRVVPWLWGLPPNDRRYYPLYAACIDAATRDARWRTTR